MNVGQREPRNISVLCSLLGYSRQAYYQNCKARERQALQEELLLQEVLRVRKQQRRIGSRKLLVMLTNFMGQHGITIGRDGFFALLRNHGLLVQKRKRSRAQTTFSHHWLRKYSNLIIDFIPIAPNQLWVSDITYIHLDDGFAYLSLITDAYSRKIVGFYLSEDLSAKGCIEALKMALKNTSIPEKLIHHSDRGLQYCSNDYVMLLQDNGIRISMTQSGDPLENALAERVNGILKDELLEVCYSHLEHTKIEVAIAISIYNHYRPHSSIDMLTPAEAHLRTGELKKRWKNYYHTKQKEVTMEAPN